MIKLKPDSVGALASRSLAQARIGNGKESDRDFATAFELWRGLRFNSNSWSDSAFGNSPTHVRHWVVGVTTLTSFLLYLDRVCVAEIAKGTQFLDDLKLDDRQIDMEITRSATPVVEVLTPQGMEEIEFNLKEMFSNIMPKKTKKQTMRVGEAEHVVTVPIIGRPPTLTPR